MKKNNITHIEFPFQYPINFSCNMVDVCQFVTVLFDFLLKIECFHIAVLFMLLSSVSKLWHFENLCDYFHHSKKKLFFLKRKYEKSFDIFTFIASLSTDSSQPQQKQAWLFIIFRSFSIKNIVIWLCLRNICGWNKKSRFLMTCSIVCVCVQVNRREWMKRNKN